MEKRKDECFKCSSKKCYTRIVTKDKSFDEVACGNHISDLEKHADDIFGKNNGVMRTHISSSAKLSRERDIDK